MRLRSLLFALLLCFAAPAAIAEPEKAPGSPSSLPADLGNVILTAKGNVDGRRGVETVRLYDTGYLVAGTYWVRAEHVWADIGKTYFFKEQASLKVVRLDKKRRAILLELPTEETEDPPNTIQLFTVTNGVLTRRLSFATGGYGTRDIRVRNGTVSYVEGGWRACNAARTADGSHPEVAVRHRVVYKIPAEGVAGAPRRVRTRKKQVCNQLAACPYVYVHTPDGFVRAGEILRNLRGARAYALQELSLPRAATRTLEIRLSEEKPETTFLDEVYVELDGNIVRPTTCQSSEAPAYCVADQKPFVLHTGDILELRFELPEATNSPRLFARGFYVPRD